MRQLFAFLPCYNEEKNIGPLIDGWLDQVPGLEEKNLALTVVGIDDCSKDRTKEVILSRSMATDRVVLVAHEVNKGLCGGLNTSIRYFLEHGKPGDLMALMDGDNTHNPMYIHSMVEKLFREGKDCVIASRYCTDSGVVGVAGHRRFMSDMAKYYYSMILRVPDVRDYTCGYRLYTYEIIAELTERFGPEPIVEKSFACMMELLYRLYLVGGTFGEVGFELRYDNKQGESKMRVFTTMKNSLLTALKLRKMKGNQR